MGFLAPAARRTQLRFPGPRAIAFVAAFVVLLAGGRAAAQDPTPIGPSPLANPNLDLWAGGTVLALARLPDGSLIVGGDFESIFDPGFGLSIDRRNLAKFSAAGALDLAWNPSPNRRVTALAVDAAGAVYVGGNFDQIGGLARTGVTKLSGSGSGAVDPNWTATTNVSPCPATGDCVQALALAPNDTLIVGGAFTTVGGAARASIARLATATGLADAGWNPGILGILGDLGRVHALAVDGSGNVFAGGYYFTAGGAPRLSLAKFSSTGDVDATWNPAPGATVRALTLDGAGKLYVGGDFCCIGGQLYSFIARLSTTGAGAADAGWAPQPLFIGPFLISSLLLDGAGSLYVGGSFSAIGSLGQRYLARVSTSNPGLGDAGFAPVLDRPVYALLREPNGDIQAGGPFSRVGGQQSLGLVRLSSTGATVRKGYVQDTAEIRALARAADGGTYVGGRFERANVLERGNVLRLAPDGTLDPTWNPSVAGTPTLGASGVFALAVDGAGSLFIGGGFSSVGGQTRDNIAKVSATGAGAVDGAWIPGASGPVDALAATSGGKLYAGGRFGTIGGQTRRAIARLPTTGNGAAESWNPNPSNLNGGGDTGPSVAAILVDASGDVFVGGAFTSIGGADRVSLARLAASGNTLAVAGWDPALDNCQPSECAASIVADGLGFLLVGGIFDGVDGIVRPRLARISVSTGQLDATFNAGFPLTAGTAVRSLARDAGGGLYLGGNFAIVGGAGRKNLARIQATTGVVDTTWDPNSTGVVFPIQIGSTFTGPLYVGGQFSAIDGKPRRQLAAIPTVQISPLVFADSFE